MDENKNMKDDFCKSEAVEYGSISNSLSIPSETKPKKAKTKYTSTQWLTLVTLAFGKFCSGSSASLQAPFFPFEAQQKGATSTEYGFIFGIFQLSIFATAPIMGKLIAYVSPKFVLNSGMLTLGITSNLFGTLDMVESTQTFVALAFVVRAVEGVGSAAIRTACGTIIASQFPNKVGTVFAVLETFGGVGTIIGPTVGGALYDLGGFGLPFHVVGTILLIDAVVIYFVLPDVVIGIDGSPKVPRKGNLLKFWCHPKTILYALSVFTVFNFLGFNQVALEPHIRQFELSSLYVGMIFALGGSVYAIASPIWGWLCDKLSCSETLCLVGCCLHVCSLLVIGPAPFFNLEPSIVLILVSQVLFGLGFSAKLVCSFTGTIVDVKKRDLSPDFSTYGLVASMITSSQSLGAFLGPSVGGYLLDLYGFRMASMALLILETVLIIWLIISIVKSNLWSQTVSGSEPENSKEPVSISHIAIENCSEMKIEKINIIGLEAHIENNGVEPNNK